MSSTQEKLAEWKRRRKLVEITCAHCGEQFRAAKYLNQTYCSGEKNE